MTAGESRSDFKLITDTPYLALTGELWGVYYENYEENWPRYNGTALYLVFVLITIQERYDEMIDHDTLHVVRCTKRASDSIAGTFVMSSNEYYWICISFTTKSHKVFTDSFCNCFEFVSYND